MVTSVAFSGFEADRPGLVANTGGCKDVLSVWLAEEGQWQLLSVTDDPISLGESLVHLTGVLADLSTESAEPPTPAVLTTEKGVYPRLPSGHLGEFTWEHSQSATIAEVVEFDYGYAARLRVLRAPIGRASAGGLWTVRDQWHWRVWSIAPDGQVAFSESRTFVQ